MDPSIMKLLEEDEDESMHSGAAVEAFTAALNRDIAGDTSTSQHSDSDTASFSQGSNHLFAQWQSSIHDANTDGHKGQDLNGSGQQEQHSSKMELKQQGSGPQSQQIDAHFSQTMFIPNSEMNPIHITEPNREQNLESSQFSKKMNNQQAIVGEQAMNSVKSGKQVPFGMLLPILVPQLDKERGMQLNTLYMKLKKNEISKMGFVRHMKAIVGDHMLKMAVCKVQVQAQKSQAGPNQSPLQSQASAQPQHLKMPSVGANQGTVLLSHVPSSAAQQTSYSTNAMTNSNVEKSLEMEWKSDSSAMPASQTSISRLSNINQEREHPTIPIQGLSKLQQQHLHFSPPSFAIDGSKSGNYHQFSGSNVSTSASSLKQQPHDSLTRQGPTQVTNVLSVPKFERPNSVIGSKRVQVGTLMPHNWPSSTTKDQKNDAISSMTFIKEEPVDQGSSDKQLKSRHGLSSLPPSKEEQRNITSGTSSDNFPTSRCTAPSNSVPSPMTNQLDPSILSNSPIPSATSPAGPKSSQETPPIKTFMGQKKPLESLCSSPPPPSKKQKVSGPFLDESIEQLNDVTAVSGVNLREEEEHLFSGPKEDNRVSEASRRVVQEEEERLILQNIPLREKVAEIIAKCGLMSISNDVERCLSLCVEERLRGLISNLIRLSKQRVDIEKPRHRTLITSDVQQQITAINQKARAELDKKQTEAEKLQNLYEPEGGVDGDKDEGRVKSFKANKEEDDKMRTTAANVAARAAVGGDDMLSKWQLMAEQARQKRGGGDVFSGSQPGTDLSRKPLSTSQNTETGNQEAEKRGHQTDAVTFGLSRKFARNQGMVPHSKVNPSISIKDVIAALEREPQMLKTTLIYRLYEKARANVVAK
ncbi:transcription initiation factor TFIID subunit 4b-like isoform X2 [Rhododendron vialii]|uniref:transcription initiation factor TFIID subunit 4b-like isoform X2 n=1 Tax=Rhododendron vialii TaxID=182163 RepID=UPI00265E0F70|nr:transcription initiation factor TFIID subunit 4b-like isoform X2 [Rhododendron vialii]